MMGMDMAEVEPPRLDLKSLPYAGIRSGELTGHRLWYVQSDLTLCSLINTDCEWKPGEIISGDVYEELDPWRHALTGKQLWGGVYAFRDAEQLGADTRALLLERFPNEIVTPRPGPFEMDPLTAMAFYGSAAYRTKTIIGFAIGTVSLWGEVFEHEGGYRAQFAKVKKITAVPTCPSYDEAMQVMEKYNRKDK